VLRKKDGQDYEKRQDKELNNSAYPDSVPALLSFWKHRQAGCNPIVIPQTPLPRFRITRTASVGVKTYAKAHVTGRRVRNHGCHPRSASK
jgi:hypothetical protein